MNHLDHEFDLYIGIDIVSELVAELRAKNTSVNRHFQVNNIVTDILPRADDLFCRDCLVHLPFEMIEAAINRWKLSGFRYLMVTTFTDHQENQDCKIGVWQLLVDSSLSISLFRQICR